MSSDGVLIDQNDENNKRTIVNQNNKKAGRPELKLDIKFTSIPKTRSESFAKVFTAYDDGLERSEPGGFVVTPDFGSNIDDVYRLVPRPDDVWLLTFPKCGTTWTSEMLWLLVNDCNYELAKQEPLMARAPCPK